MRSRCPRERERESARRVNTESCCCFVQYRRDATLTRGLLTNSHTTRAWYSSHQSPHCPSPIQSNHLETTRRYYNSHHTDCTHTGTDLYCYSRSRCCNNTHHHRRCYHSHHHRCSRYHCRNYPYWHHHYYYYCNCNYYCYYYNYNFLDSRNFWRRNSGNSCPSGSGCWPPVPFPVYGNYSRRGTQRRRSTTQSPRVAAPWRSDWLVAVYFVSAPADWTSYRPVLELFVVVLFLLSSQRNRGCLRRGIFNSVLDLCPQQKAGVSVTSPSRFVCLRQPGWSFVVVCRAFLVCVVPLGLMRERCSHFAVVVQKLDFLLSNYGFSAVMLYRKFVTAGAFIQWKSPFLNISIPRARGAQNLCGDKSASFFYCVFFFTLLFLHVLH